MAPTLVDTVANRGQYRVQIVPALAWLFDFGILRRKSPEMGRLLKVITIGQCFEISAMRFISPLLQRSLRDDHSVGRVVGPDHFLCSVDSRNGAGSEMVSIV